MTPNINVDVINELDLQVRQRRQIMQARIRLENQLGALERTIKEETPETKRAAEAARAISPVLAAHLDALVQQQKPFDKAIEKLAKRLHVFDWVQATPGIGALSLGLIIGETGSLTGYSGPAKVWKRLGLAVMPDGTRQRRVANDAAAAIAHGYSPRRRSLMHVVGTSLIRCRKSPYRDVYNERKALELTKGVTLGHAHMRAMRYMEKRLVRDLWVAWNVDQAKQEAA